MSPIVISIVEDDPRYRQTLELVLHRSPGVSVRHSWPSAEALFQALPQALATDLVLMDLDLPGVDGVEAIARLREHSEVLPVVVLTAFGDPQRIVRAVKAGADGYLLKSATPQELLHAIHQAVEGGAPLAPDVARSMVELMRADGTAAPLPPDQLTPRELQVLRMLADGLAYKQIASELQISIDTVRHFVRGLYRKIGVHSAHEAVGKALRSGWIN